MSGLATAPPAASRSTGWADPRGLGPTRGWRLPLRLALRDLRRHPGRTSAAAVMVAVPVLLAAAVSVGLATAAVSPAEDLRAQLGSADAVVITDPVEGPADEPWTAAQVTELVGAPVVEVARGSLRLSADSDLATTDVLATDLSQPATDGLLTVSAGRLPRSAGETALSPGLADDLGVGVGDAIEAAGKSWTVTGLAAERWSSPATSLAVVVADMLPAGTADPFASTWLVPDAGDVPMGGLAPGLRVVGEGTIYDEGGRLQPRDIFATSVVMAGVALALVVLEIALLAGPAFAVGVRQQQQTLALLAATGADGRALRRVVLAQALAVGAGASVAAAALGVGLALVGAELARTSTYWLVGPLEVPWVLVVGFIVVGVVSAVASALVPAVAATRATVVGALALRPSTRRLPWRRPVLGLALLVVGLVLLQVAAVDGLSDPGIVGALAVLIMGVGMVLVVPLPVALLGRATTRLPLGFRLAGRESTRAATRTVAAVAAVAGASAALVAGLTVTAAIRTQDAADYTPRSAYGVTTIYSDVTYLDPASVAARLQAAAPDAEVAVSGDPTYAGPEDGIELYRSFWLPSPGCPSPPAAAPAPDVVDPCWTGWFPDPSSSSAPAVVDTDAAALRGFDLTAGQQGMLAAGGVLVPAGSLVDVSSGRVTIAVGEELFGAPMPDVADAGSEEPSTRSPVRSAEFAVGTWDLPPELQSTQYGGDVGLLLSPQAAEALGVATASEVHVLPAGVDPTSTPAEVAAATEPLLRAVPSAVARQALTEVGYVDRWRVVDLVVVLAAAIIVLGATLTATSLALADARRDRTVLTALGAAPRTQRASAGATAVLISGTGAVVGGTVGLLVGLVVAGAMLQPTVASVLLQFGAVYSSRTLQVVPWGWLAAFVVGLPLLAGLVVAAVAKGRTDAEASRATARVV